jgi:carboxypeptidase family protein/TonB-dependent receptor-like protein
MQTRLSLFIRTFVSGLFVLILSVNVSAQFKAGIQGTVTDTSGGVVPDATLTLTNAETGKKQAAISNDEGFYRFSGLAPGKYSMKVEKTGYMQSSFENLVVNAEGIQGIDVLMEAGEITAIVTVPADTVGVLRTEDANVDRALTTQEVRQLPQNGRDPYELARLTPGVFGDGARGGNGNSVNLPNTTGPGGSNNSIFQTENQVPISANGQRLSSNNFTIDGVSVNSYNWGGAAIVTPNQEAVKEIRVLSASYSAEDGRNSGAQIKVVSQNGGNDVHGSAFFKYNSPKLNAFNKYGGPNGAKPVRVNDYVRQFGGSIGGPLPLPHFGEGGPTTVWGRNKSFFFFSYEGLRKNVTNTAIGFVETPEYRQLIQQLRPSSVTARVLSASGMTPRITTVLTPTCGNFGNDPNRCRVVSGGLDIGSPTGAIGQYVSLGNPVGGGFDGIPDIQQVQFSLPGRNEGNQYNLRLDFTPNSRDSITASTFMTSLDNLNSDSDAAGRPIADLPFKPFNSSGTILYTHIFSPTLLNEARFNVSRFHIDQVSDVEAAGTNLGIPRVEVEGLPFPKIKFGAPQSEGTPGKFAQNTFELSDTVSKTMGNHGFRFGGVVRKEQDNSDLSAGGARPVYSFSGFWNLANDTPIFEGINADPRNGSPATFHPYFRNNYYAVFVQDDWKAKPNLTLNLGLRYEYYSPVTEKFGRLTNVFFTNQNLNTIQVRQVERLYDPDRNNFAPRFGFAYTPSGKHVGNLFNGDRAVIRGGAGISYNRIPVAPLNNVRGNPPFFARFNLCCGTASTDFGSPFAGGTILYATGTTNSIGSYPINPALGQGVRPDGSVVAGPVELWGTPQDLPNPYVYAYSLEMQYELFANLVATAGYQGSAGHKLIRLVNQNYIFPNNPNFNRIFFSTPDVNSNYNALNLNLTRRYTKGLALQANYRWSKSIDQLSYEGPGFETNQTFPQDNRTERGPSDFDVRHYFNASALYELPFFKGRNDLAEKVLGGFQITGIVTYRTGFPFTPVSGFSVSTPGGPSLDPTRPQGYSGPSDLPTSNDAFIAGIFGPNGANLFTRINGAPPGIGRNSFRGPKYFNTDLSLVKQIPLSKISPLGEAANLELRANFFNVFNQLNLKPFNFGSAPTHIDNPDNFGRAQEGLAGRVIEFQGRLRF